MGIGWPTVKTVSFTLLPVLPVEKFVPEILRNSESVASLSELITRTIYGFVHRAASTMSVLVMMFSTSSSESEAPYPERTQLV